MLTPFYLHPLLNLSYNKYKGCKVFCMSGTDAQHRYSSRFAANSPGVGVLLYLSEHESVCVISL